MNVFNHSLFSGIPVVCDVGELHLWTFNLPIYSSIRLKTE